ncbi:MAG: cellulose synthase [Rhodobacteraceae bacterium]|nr:cellulose synthase [Paracoccaceae bacterium]
MAGKGAMTAGPRLWLWAICLGGALLAGPVAGQDATGPTPGDSSPLIVIPPLDTGPAATAAPVTGAPTIEPSVIERDAQGPAAAPAPPATWSIPLSPVDPTLWTKDGILRLTGTETEVALRLFLPAGVNGDHLVLSYRSSIDLLPDGSRVDVLVNGTAAGSFSPDQFSGFAPKTIDLSAHPLQPGENIVTLQVSQRHRIYCGPSASFAVWTEIDLPHSGVRLAEGSLQPGADSFLAALSAARGPIDVTMAPLAADPNGPATMRALLGVLSTAVGDVPVPMRVASPYSVAGPNPARVRISIRAADHDETTFRVGGDGALVLIVQHRADAVPDLSALAKEIAAEAGARPMTAPELPGAKQLVPGRVTRLSALGFHTVTTRSYYLRRDAAFRLPGDWLDLASQKALLTLNYGFAAGLPKGGLMLVKVNGQTVQLLPLDRGPAGVRPPLKVPFLARLLHPDQNAITFEIIIPGDPPDQPCPIRKDPMVTILDTTTLFVPPTPRMVLPNLATPLSTIGGDAVSFDGQPDGRADPSLPFSALLQPLAQGGAGTAHLHVVDLRDMSRVPLGDEGISTRSLEGLLLPPVAKLPVADAATDTTADDQAPPEQPGWLQGLIDGLPPLNLSARASALWDYVQRLGRRSGDGPLASWLAARNGQAVLLDLDPAHRDDLWLVLAPGADPWTVAQAVQSGRLSSAGPRDQVAVLKADGTWDSWQSGNIWPILVEPLTIQNLRLVLGNLISWAPLILVIAMLGLAWISSLIALFFVLSTRGRHN